MNNKKRQSGIELMRIIAIYMIMLKRVHVNIVFQTWVK